jgi:peptidoglycan/xylan/chitin deacetylase (PgdA/CDA1 family)
VGTGKSAHGVTTRRALLVAGGLTVLAAVYTHDPALRLAGAGQAHPVHPTPAPDGPHPAPDHSPAASPPAAPTRTARLARQEPAGTRPAGPGHGHGHDGNASDLPMTHVHDGRKGIALTIDDGPSPVYTPQILQLLARYRVTATFSVVGLQVAAHPAMAREVAAAGHVIANHTWSHLDLAWQPPAVIADQFNRATGAIHQATDRVPSLFRAPYGAWSPAILERCAQTGMTPLGWSVDPRDWSRPGVPSIVGNIMRNTGTGSIILEHDGGGDRAQTVAALKIVLPRLLAAGYHFTTP